MFQLQNLHNPGVLWLFGLLPVLVLWAWTQRRRRAALRFSRTRFFAQGTAGWRPRAEWFLVLLQVAATGLCVVGLARPQERNSRSQDASVEGIDIVVALDLSTSMEAGDFRPNNRLHVAKELLREFVSGRVNDRIALVVFAGVAYTQAPLTLDYGVLTEVVGQLKTRVLEDGTAIGDALAVSLNRLRESDAKSKVVILITDGDNNAGKISPLDAAGMAKSLGVKVFTILVGKGGRVPFPAGVDLFGNTAWREVEIPINPKLLAEISKTTGGEAYRATDPAEFRAGLQKILDAMERSKLLEGGVFATYRETFHPFLLGAFFLVVLERLLRWTLFRVFP